MEQQLRRIIQTAVGSSVSVNWGWPKIKQKLPHITLVSNDLMPDYKFDGPNDYVQESIQLDIWANDYLEMLAVRKQVIAAVSGKRFDRNPIDQITVEIIRTMTGNDPAAQHARCSIDLNVFYDSI